MVEVLAAHAPAGRKTLPGWWPVDLLILFYLVAAGLLIAFNWARVPGAWWLVSLHVAGACLIIWQAKAAKPLAVFRYWYPLPYVAACYKEMSILIPAIRRTDLDLALARLDYALWGVHPTVWLERFQTPLLTEFLQFAYSLFVPMVLLVAFLLWVGKRYEQFRYYAFLIALGFLASYVGYFLVPARGPRFVLSHLQHVNLEGIWLFKPLQSLLDELESAHYDCFPSGHTELILLAWWGSREISNNLFRGFSVYTVCIILATVYLRYHYTVDLLAGGLLAFALIVVAPRIYRSLRALIDRA